MDAVSNQTRPARKRRGRRASKTVPCCPTCGATVNSEGKAVIQVTIKADKAKAKKKAAETVHKARVGLANLLTKAGRTVRPKC